MSPIERPVLEPDVKSALEFRGDAFERWSLLGALALAGICAVAVWSGTTRETTPVSDDPIRAADLATIVIGDPPRRSRRRAARSRQFEANDGGTGGSHYDDGTRFTIVGVGETLRDVAARELGSAARAAEILRLNDVVDPFDIAAGTRLQLPAR